MYFYPLSDFSFSSAGIADANEENDSILDNFYNSLNHDMINLTVDKNYCLLISKSTDTSMIKKEINLFDTVEGNVLGEITFDYNGEQIGQTPITNGNPSLSSQMSTTEASPENDNGKKTFTVTPLKIIIFIAAVIILFMLGIALRNAIQEKKRNDRRKKYTRIERKRKRGRHIRRNKDDYFF